MTFNCPSCKRSGTIDDSKVPDSGVYANCPDCNTRFLIKPAAPQDFTFDPIQEKSTFEDFKENISAKIQNINSRTLNSELPLIHIYCITCSTWRFQ